LEQLVCPSLDITYYNAFNTPGVNFDLNVVGTGVGNGRGFDFLNGPSGKWFQLKSDILKKRNYEKTIKYLSIMFLGLGLLATSSCETTNLDLTD
jgi:hypothetical protein